MAEGVVLAAPSWHADGDGGVFIALPVACMDCTVKSTAAPFPDYNPFQRGLLMFLLAEVERIDQLSKLLGISDPAFIDLMAEQLERDKLVQRTSTGGLRATRQAVDAYLSAPKFERVEHGTLFYFHDGRRGFVVAGPLRQDVRIEGLQLVDDRVSEVSVGTEGSPYVVPCVVPDLPAEPPLPIIRQHAASGAQEFVKRAKETSIVRTLMSEETSLVLRDPRWERLLVRVNPSTKAHRNERRPSAGDGKPLATSLSVRIADKLVSHYSARQLETMMSNRSPLEATVRRMLAERTKREERPIASERVPRPDPHDTADAIRTAPVLVLDVSARARLADVLCRRVAMLNRDVHLPLTAERSDTLRRVVQRLASLGFRTTDVAGDELMLPLISDEALAAARMGQWDDIDHLWLAFVAWAFLEDDGQASSLASVIGDLPAIVAEAHWGRLDAFSEEIEFVIDHIASMQEVE